MADFVKIYNTNGVPLYINLDHIICVEFQKNNKKYYSIVLMVTLVSIV